MGDDARTPVVLAVETGHVFVRGALFDVVDGSYRVIGATREPVPPMQSHGSARLAMALWALVRDLQRVSGRALLDSQGNLLPRRDAITGVDHTVIALSGGPRVGVIGLTADLSTDAAIRAAADVGEVVSSVSIAETSDRRSFLGDLLDLLFDRRPDILVFTGGTEGGAAEPLWWAARVLGNALDHGWHHLPVIYAGNGAASTELEALLADRCDFRIVENVRPSRDVERPQPLQGALRTAWLESIQADGSGIREAQSWSNASLVSARQAFAVALTQFARQRSARVSGVDVGASGVTLMRVGPDARVSSRRISHRFGSPDDEFAALARTHRTDDSGRIPLSAPAPIRNDPAQERRPELAPVEERGGEVPPPDEVALDALYNWWSRPAAVPLAGATRDLAYTALGSRARATSDAWPPPLLDRRSSRTAHLLIGRGGAIEEGFPREAALLIANALQPAGASEVMVDQGGALALAGAAESVVPGLVSEVVTSDTLVGIGTIVGARGALREDQACGRLILRFGDGQVDERALTGGQVESIAIGYGKLAEAMLQPARGIDLGAGNGKRLTLRLIGPVGLWIDLRGRPLPAERTLCSPRGAGRVANQALAGEPGKAPGPASWITGRLGGIVGHAIARR
ncbi:MAG: glutamate mutase L [Chloroflexi bacterium]|nr:glutamate mutase L [Chloroflexota bacterium]